MSMITPEQIEIFLAVARYKNFSKAAGSLYVSHSTVSRSIAALEEQLNTQLLVRSSRSVSLTEAGELLAERAPELLQSMVELENDVRSVGNRKDSRLRVASISVYSQLLFKLYRKIQMDYPAIRLDVDQLPLRDVNEHVINGSVDVGITLSFALPGDLGDYIVKVIDSGMFRVVVPSDHPLAGRDSVHISELQDHARLALDQEAGGPFPPIERFNRVLQTNSGRAQMKVSSIETLAMSIKAGVGVDILPEHVASQFGEGCRLLRLDGIEAEYELMLFAKRDNPNPALKTFLNMLDRVVADGAQPEP